MVEVLGILEGLESAGDRRGSKYSRCIVETSLYVEWDRILFVNGIIEPAELATVASASKTIRSWNY